MSLADAIINKNTVEVKKFLAMDQMNLDAQDEYGFTPLIQCAIVNSVDLAHLVLDAGADCNTQALTGATALYWAVENNNVELVALLLKHGADPNIYTSAGEAPLVKAMMRRYLDVKNTLIDAGADLSFAYDFVNTKLLGHRYELIGRVDIVDNQGRFTEIDYEGFFLEFSLLAVRNSIADYVKHYEFRQQLEYSPYFDRVLASLQVASDLVKYQQYNVNLKEVADHIIALLRKDDLLIIPIAHAGHASAIVYLDGYLVVCDRRQDAHVVNSLGVYKVGNPKAFSDQLIYHLLYTKKPRDFMSVDFYELLNLDFVAKILMPAQITGNCSWSNIEATLPAALHLLYQQEEAYRNDSTMITYQDLPMAQFHVWQEWDLARELKFCLDAFDRSDTVGQASKASTLAAIMFQRLSYARPADVDLARRLLRTLDLPQYRYILDSYLQVYDNWDRTQGGQNLKKLIEKVQEPDF